MHSDFDLSTRSLNRLVATAVVLLVTVSIGLPQRAWGWGSDESSEDSTHRRVVRQAAELLETNLGNHPYLQEASDILQQHMDDLLSGSVAPDFDSETPYYLGATLMCERVGRECRSQNLYNDHFFDADTHEGLPLSHVLKYESNILRGALGDLPPENAESQTRRYVGIALASWRDAARQRAMGNDHEAEALFADAAYWLGYAAHYFSDIFEPHHAANYPWGPLNRSHTEFEELVDENLEKFLPEDEINQNDLEYAATREYVSLTEFITDYASTYALWAKSYLRDCIHTYFSWFPREWEDAAGEMTRANRDVLSLFFYRFLHEATTGTSSSDLAGLPVGEFNVEIQTGKGFVPFVGRRHPAEAIRLEIDFQDGSRKTWTLDTSNFYRWYAFNSDTNSSYFLGWGEDLPRPSEVIAVRLERGWAWWGWAWEINRLEIFIHGIRVLQTDRTMLLPSAGEIDIPVANGLRFN